MYAPATFAAILAFTSVALANPLAKRDPNNFRLFQVHQFQDQCVPGAICGGSPVNSVTINVHDDCNGGGCDGKNTGQLSDGDSFCDKDVTVCDRTLQLVSRGDGDCRPLRDLGEGDSGSAYATLVEGGNRVGACEVDFSKSSSKTCGALGGAFEFKSQVFCHFD